MSLVEQLKKPGKREALVADATRVLDAEVADKRGLSGTAIKATFKVVKKGKPGFVPYAIDDLLDDFVGQVEPFYERWAADGAKQSCSQYFAANGSAVADALLGITDGRAEKSKHRTLVKAYEKLRPKGKQHVEAAMPRVGELIERHTAELRS